MRIGEGISREVIQRLKERGLIRAIPLSRGARCVHAEDLAKPDPGGFTGFAPLREDDDVIRVSRVHPIDN